MNVDYISHMGDDLTVVNAARVSFDKESEWVYNTCPHCEGNTDRCWEFDDVCEGPHEHKTVSQKDAGLIRYLAKHGHWTPFSHPQITLREKVPIFVARQRFKHMVGFTYNEVSRRYVDSPPEFFYPDFWRERADNKKQGSSVEVVSELSWDIGGLKVEDEIFNVYDRYIDSVANLYKTLIDNDVCPEQARMILPVSQYTEYYVTGSLAAWARAYKQRIDPHAQKEIQGLAVMWGEILEPLFPVSWKELIK